MSKKVYLEQGSDEWHRYRRTRIGASDSAVILGKSPYNNAYDLWHEKMSGEQKEPNRYMLAGLAIENEAREWFEKETGIHVEPAIFEHDEHSFLFASLDGWNEEQRVVLEIKKNGRKNHELAKQGIIPEYYQLQCNQQICCSAGLQHYYLSYPGDDTPVLLRYAYDRDLMTDQITAAIEFYESMLSFTPPEPPYVECDSYQWRSLSNDLARVRKRKKELEDEEKKIIEEIRNYAEDRPTKGAGLTLSKHFRKGTVDYNKIPELKNVDLDQYRKKGKEVWTVKLI